MTRIEKLEMQGFKSFSRKTLVTFPSNFSVICGPNGSGKSNVLDSICFVLGRTSAKSMRAGKMLEVLFNGGKGKVPVEFAKVSIQFDNSNKIFPVEEEFLSVSRKVNRKGISIYKINGRTVTRETIIEVLRKGNIHPDGHNIILQGDVTEIIEMSPLERREIIDEISGIAEFDEKKEKAHRELEIVENRLKESAIVLTERFNILSKLESEKESAERYKILTTELDKLRATLARRRLSEAETAMKTLDSKIKEYSETDFDKELIKFDKELEKLEKEKHGLSSKLIDRSKEIEVIKSAERMKADIQRFSDKIDTNEFELKRLDDIISKLKLIQEKEMEESTNRAVKEVLKLGRTGVYGTVASLSKVPKQYQTAIEVAAGSHLHDLIVSEKDVAVECVNFLKSNRIGRATFLPLDKIAERDSSRVSKLLHEKGVVGLAIDLINFDKKYWHAFSFIFGDTVVVDKIETARDIGIGKARFVTLDGDLVERSGAIIGGFYKHDKKVFLDTLDIEKYEKQKETLEEESAKMEKEILNLKERLKGLTKEEEKGTNEVTSMQRNVLDIDQKLDQLRRNRREFYDKKVNSQEEINNLRIKKARLEAELENVKMEFENYKKIEILNDVSIETLQSKIRSNISEINSLGPINMKALEEYDQLKQDYTNLKEKVEKLTEERDKVFMMMTEIENRRKSVFMETFTAISIEFKKVFTDLVGGEGELLLQEPENIESGLIISASPPGKKVLNIESMSGGEKTLTALAFLFSIQRFKPAPFYVLDEIDAALDKPNTRKITEFLEKNSKTAQFIVISHNDTTIQKADCVYGVSMDEGESRLVGIKMPS